MNTNMVKPKEYYAFISYKREDEKWAKWLQNELEHYKFPSNLNGRTDLPKNIRPTFRDVTDLKPGLLAEEINNALQNSEWLIVICSPRSAKSPWVCKEAQTFIDLGREDHIIPFVVEGSPFSDDPVTECYPEALLNLTGSKELLAANINELGRDAAAIKVVARMFNLRFDALWQRYEREQIKEKRIIIGVCVAITIISLGIALWVLNKNHELTRIQARVVAKEAEKLVEEGDTYTARLLLLEFSKSNYFDSNIEAILRKADSQNTAILYGGSSAKNCAVYSADGKYIISGDQNGKVTTWDAQTGKIIKSTDEENCPVKSVTCSANGKYFVAAKLDVVRVWDFLSGENIKTIKDNDDKYTYASFSPDGAYIASATQNGIKIWDIKTWEKVHFIETHSGVINNLSYSPDGLYIVTASHDEIAEIWDVNKGKSVCKLEGHYASFSPNGQQIATVSRNNGIIIWDNTGKKIKTIDYNTAYINSIKYSPDGKYLVTASDDKTVKIWDVLEGKILHTMFGHKGMVEEASFSMDGKSVVSASYDHSLRIWSIVNQNEVMSIKDNNTCITTDVSADGIHFATGMDDGTINIWNQMTKKKEKTLIKHSGMVRSVSFSPDGKSIVSTSDDSTVKVWDVKSSKLKMTLDGHKAVTLSARFSPNGLYIASSSWDGTIIIWESNTGKLVQTLKGHHGAVNSVAFSPDGKQIISGSDDKTIKIWDTTSGKEIFTLWGHGGPVCSVLFCPDGRNAISTSFDFSIRWWYLDNCVNYLTLDNHDSAIYSIDFCPKGNYYVTASNDHTLRVWDYDREIQIIKGHSAAVTSAVFCKDGKHILSSSLDGTIKLWEFPSFDDLINKTRKRFENRQLSYEERQKYYIE